MLIKSSDMLCETREHMRGGDGSVNILNIVSKEHLPSKTRLLGLVTLESGCGIGRHEHTGESEVYYILSGEGVLDDNGTTRAIKQGDSHICRSGESHALRNEAEQPLQFIAAIILD